MNEWQWREVVPVWACLEFYRRYGTGMAMYWTDWKATPKGGKLSYSTYDNVVVSVQLFK